MRINAILKDVIWDEEFCGLCATEMLAKFNAIFEENTDIIFKLKKGFSDQKDAKEPKLKSKNNIPRKIRNLMGNKHNLSKIILATKSPQ